jgi:hypothetical protein
MFPLCRNMVKKAFIHEQKISKKPFNIVKTSRDGSCKQRTSLLHTNMVSLQDHFP